MKNCIRVFCFLVILSALGEYSYAEKSVDINYIVSFRDRRNLGTDFETGFSCVQESGLNVDEHTVLKRLKHRLKYSDILLSDKSDFILRVYLTHADCGNVGKIDHTVYPLFLGSSDDSFANANIRLVSELSDRRSGEILSTREFVSLSKITRKTSGIFMFYTEYESQQVYWSDLLLPLVDKLADGAIEDLQR